MHTRAKREIWDITETEPIPKGASVLVMDYDGAGGLFVVSYCGRIYLADPDELVNSRYLGWDIRTRTADGK